MQAPHAGRESIDGDPTRPTEISLAAFLMAAAASAVLIRPPQWSKVLLALLLISWAALSATLWIRTPRARWLRSMRILLPLALFPSLYKISGLINIGLRRWRLDEAIANVEARLFRGQPSMFLSERFPWVGLSEALHACYLGLYLLIPLPAVLLLTQRREREAARAVFALSLCLFFLMLFWIWLPVTSPLYRYPLIHGPQASGFFFRLAHRVSRQGGVLGAAFPSGHAALASLALLICWRWIRKAFWIVLGPTFGLLAATVYCRYHFALDTLAGILVGAAAYLLLVGRRRASVAPPIGATATSISTGRGGRPIR